MGARFLAFRRCVLYHARMLAGRPWSASLAGVATAMILTAVQVAAAEATVGASASVRGSSADSGAAASRDEVLSNERTVTRWAHTAYPAWIRARPDAGSTPVGRLRWRTEDGFPEVYLVLRRRWTGRGVAWIQLRIPMRPNGRVGWVPQGALEPLHVSNSQLVVDRRRLRISLYRRGRRVWTAPVGIGAPASPTPAGHFWIRERFKVSDPSSPYAPYAFGTSDYSTLTDWPGGGVVGIHGDWQQPWLIPGRPSHGCIRLRDSDDAWLAHHVATGTPLRVA